MKRPSPLATFFKKDSSSTAAFVLTGLLVFTQWIVVLIYIWRLPPQIPLYDSLPAGKNQLAPANHLLILPILSTLFSLTNLAIIRMNFRIMNPYLRTISWANTLVVSLLLAAMTHKLMLTF